MHETLNDPAVDDGTPLRIIRKGGQFFVDDGDGHLFVLRPDGVVGSDAAANETFRGILAREAANPRRGECWSFLVDGEEKTFPIGRELVSVLVAMVEKGEPALVAGDKIAVFDRAALARMGAG